MRFAIVIFIALPILIGGIIFLQIFLSKKQSRWPGLVLPFIAFAFSLLAVAGIAAYGSFGLTERVVTTDGEVVEHVLEEQAIEPFADPVSLAVTIVSVFLLYNIPTAILLAIYGACRERLRRRLALEKMSAQDLE